MKLDAPEQGFGATPAAGQPLLLRADFWGVWGYNKKQLEHHKKGNFATAWETFEAQAVMLCDCVN
jgi:hypothetical protein